MAVTPITSIRLRPKLKARLVAIAQDEGLSLTQLIDRVTSAYADKVEGRKK